MPALQRVEGRGQRGVGDMCARLGHRHRRAVEQSLGRIIGHSPLRPGADADARRCAGELLRIAEIAAAGGRNQQRRVGQGAREGTDGVQALAHQLHTDARDGAIAGLEADHAAKRRRADDAAGCLGAERHRKEARRHTRRRAGGRAARCVAGVMRVGGGARAACGEFGGHGLAHHHTAGGFRQRHGRRIGARAMIGPNRRAVFGGQIGGVQHVLHANRNPGKAAADGLAGANLGGVVRGEGANGGLGGLDALKLGFMPLRNTQPPRGNPRQSLGGCQHRQCTHRSSPPRHLMQGWRVTGLRSMFEA